MLLILRYLQFSLKDLLTLTSQGTLEFELGCWLSTSIDGPSTLKAPTIVQRGTTLNASSLTYVGFDVLIRQRDGLIEIMLYRLITP